MAQPSLSASDGLSWVTQGARTLRRFWPLWLVCWVGYLVVMVGLGVLDFFLQDHLSVVGQAIGGLLLMVGSIGLQLSGWALALDRVGYQPFRWSEVGRSTLRLTGLVLVIVLVLGVVAGGLVSVGLMAHPTVDDLVLMLMLALPPVILVALVVAFLLTFLPALLLDGTAGHRSLIGAMGASSRMVRRHWLAILVASLLSLIAMMVLVILVAVPFMILAPRAWPLANVVLQPLFYLIMIVVMAGGYAQIRTHEREATTSEGSGPTDL